MRNVTALADSVASPAIHIVSVKEASKSHLGGSPRMPSAFRWPEWKGRRLAFLARLSLPELHRARRIDWLPPDGALLFFYDMDEEPWGFDPEDRGSCAILHVADLDAPLVHGAEDNTDASFPRVNVAFREIIVFPTTQSAAGNALELSEEEREKYWELLETPFNGLPKHQVAGLPAAIQADRMELECQLVTNGLNSGYRASYTDPRAKQLEHGAKDWRLLLQLDTDDEAGIMWGDTGTLYFWIRAQEAASGNFRNPWLILQCC